MVTDVIAKRREYQREYRKRPDVLARKREYRREYYKRPDVIAKYKQKYKQKRGSK